MVAVCRMLPQWTAGAETGSAKREEQQVDLVGRLTHGLVSGGYGGGVVEHQDLSLKLPGGLRHQLGGDHHHAFPDGRALDLRGRRRCRARSTSLPPSLIGPHRRHTNLFEGKRGRLTAVDLLDGHPLAVDGFDGDGGEGAERVRAQQQRVVELNHAL